MSFQAASFQAASPARAFTCREITTEEGFLGLRDAWEELFVHAAYPTPFGAWEWAWHWWRRLAAADPLAPRLLILAVFGAGGKLAGLAPFYYPTWTGSLLLQRPLRLLGTRIRCGMEDMTDEPILLLRQGAESEALGAILSHLARRRQAPWDITHLQVMRRREDDGLAELWRRRPRASLLSHSHRRLTDGQIVSLPDSWPDFRRSLSKSMRDNLPYYPRLLSRRGHDWRVRTARTPSEMAPALDTLIALHHRRAESTVGTAHVDHLPDGRSEGFLRDALSALAERGRAAVVLLEVGGVAVAAQAILEQGPMITFYYSGFDPAWHSYSPILILNAHVIEDAIARGVPTVNYLPGAEPWKTRWGATGAYVREELSWIPLRPRPALRTARRALLRARQSRTGGGCDCGFCALPLTRGEERAATRAAGVPCPSE